MVGFGCYASDRLKADRDIVLAAVQTDGQMLYYTTKELRDDKEIVLKAVEQKPLILKYASSRLRSDIDVAIMAIKSAKEKYHGPEEHYVKDVYKFLEPEIKENEKIKELLETS